MSDSRTPLPLEGEAPEYPHLYARVGDPNAQAGFGGCGRLGGVD